MMTKNILYRYFTFLCILANLTHNLHAQSVDLRSNKNLVINQIFAGQTLKNYTSQQLDSLIRKLWSERDSLFEQHQNGPKPCIDIPYYYASCMYDISLMIRTKLTGSEPWKRLMDEVKERTPLPRSEDLEQSVWAARYLDVYVDNALTDAFLETRTKGDSYLSDLLQQPLDTLKQLAGAYGERILGGFLAKHVLHSELAAFYLEGHLKKSIANKELIPAKLYLTEFERLSASGPRRLSGYRIQIAALEKSIAVARENPKIVFLDHSEEIETLAELIDPFHGKVVYLDIWGSWCGPCVAEIREHVPVLKERFRKNADVVFLYLAMESPQNMDKWKEFIYGNQLEGHHIVMTDTQIESIWVKLLGTENVPRRYPSYFVFDRSGTLQLSDALRPSDGEELYLQLESVLAIPQKKSNMALRKD